MDVLGHDGDRLSLEFAPPVPLLDIRYVDEKRTHEVHARVFAEGGGHVFEIVEGVPGSAAREDAFVTRLHIRDAWEARFHQADLEGRLGQLGAYWRHEAGRAGWVKVREHPGVPRVDIRAFSCDAPEGRVGFHHFHRGSGDDQLFVTMPRRVDAQLRHLLAGLSFSFPHVDQGHLLVLHERLPEGPLRGLLAREHMELARQGFQKFTRAEEYALSYGPNWQATVLASFRELLARIRAGAMGAGRPERTQREPDGALTEYRRLLDDPRLAAIHARFMREGEELVLLAQSEAEVRRAVAQKRRGQPHEVQHLLSILEASLLVRRAMRSGGSIAEDTARQLRRLAFYL